MEAQLALQVEGCHGVHTEDTFSDEFPLGNKPHGKSDLQIYHVRFLREYTSGLCGSRPIKK